ncbi:MAG: hypothetical protein E7079_00510 [Bacteroidales bacterium]|nr:hypothetical protein [Bacteroidales bacterium]
MKPQIVDFIHDKPTNRCRMIDIVKFISHLLPDLQRLAIANCNNPEEFPSGTTPTRQNYFRHQSLKTKKKIKAIGSESFCNFAKNILVS